MRIRHLIRVTGVVQGVGYRPFVYRLARDLGLGGFVLNDGEGVFLEAEGEIGALARLAGALKDQAPAAAQVDRVMVTPAPPVGYEEFEIRASRESAERAARVTADLATCEDCAREIRDPSQRRHQYPFTNCTLCGPRFTIVRDVPYDRARTTMAGFAMCADCRREYEDPADRRFHAQPIACPVCGPELALHTGSGVPLPSRDVLGEVRRLLRQGYLLAIKGLGGYHLACDATNELAVRTLRNRKTREEKPFALMARDLRVIRRHVHLSRAEADLLRSPQAPIVLLRRRAESTLPDSIAPAQAHLGFMLPYTPLHHLIFAIQPAREAASAGHGAAEAPGAAVPGRLDLLVMTSGNRSDEPIAFRDEDALQRLGEIADYVVSHNRPIQLRLDDSVARWHEGGPQILRRARGYAPRATRLPWPAAAHVLAVGSHLKNTFALAKGFDCFVGPHIGDLENLETFRAFEEGIRHYQRLFEIRPVVVAHDLHPDYLSTGFAQSLECEELIGCQHHEAHIASVIGEHAMEGPVIGVALDGTGYGHDGTIWGGEIFVVRDQAFTRAAHLRAVPIPGGDQATREPWRAAMAWLRESTGEEGALLRARLLAGVPKDRLALVERMLERRLNAPLSSGMGRAFDAAASLILSRHRAAYEGQGPLELEQAAYDAVRPGRLAALPYAVQDGRRPWQIDLRPSFAELARLILGGGCSRPELAWRFHRTIIEAVVEVVRRLATEEEIEDCCVSGGVFQNHLIGRYVRRRLEDLGIQVHRNVEVPANDGGISFGQVVLASWRMMHDGPPPSSGRRAGSATG